MSAIRTTIIHNGISNKHENEEDIESVSVFDPIEIPDQPHPDRIHKAPVRQIKRHRKSPWDRATTELFVNECVEQRINLRNRSISRRKIYNEIRLRMLAKGYNFDKRSLARKFRNLKTHFFIIKSRNNKPIMWPYFEQMAKIFPTETIPRHGVISSLRNITSTLQTSRSSPKRNPFGRQKNSNRIRYASTNKIDSLRDEIIALEERRTVAFEEIALQLILANKLTREKLELEKKKFANSYLSE